MTCQTLNKIFNEISYLIKFLGAAGGGVRISVSGEPKVPGAASTIAEEAVDQLQENEKLVAGKLLQS
jgi:hypothetical protein